MVVHPWKREDSRENLLQSFNISYVYLAYKKDKFLLRLASTGQRVTVLNGNLNGKNIAYIGHKEEVFMIGVVRCRKNYPREQDAPPVEVFKVMWHVALSRHS